VQRSLPEMNALKAENEIPFQFFAFHRGGEADKAKEIIQGKDAKGNEWNIDFVWSTKEFEQWLGVSGLPSYYLIDKQGRARALIAGHPDDMMATLVWLAEEIEKRG
jgi:hypothetical protein